MKTFGTVAAATIIALMPVTGAVSRERPAPVIRTDIVRGELELLAGPALRGRGSATPDEAIAAGYVASLFRDAGLTRVPGMDSYFQVAPVERRTVTGDPTLTVGGIAVPGVTVLRTGGGTVGGRAAVLSDPAAAIPAADVLVYTGPADKLGQLRRVARTAKLILATESEEIRAYRKATNGKPQLRPALVGVPGSTGPTMAALPADALRRIRDGDMVRLDVPYALGVATTTNAIGYLAGSDPAAGVILISAHLDHLGVRPDGVVMPGANDDASGTVAVIELARAFAAMGRPKRGILFVAYGSEELGGLGSTWFGLHSPIPLDRIVANIELEMIGAQDAKLPANTLMMTGADRSDLFGMLRANGALVAPDPYPEQHFFERSDNYSLALKGIVAHTLSGWVGPTYHQPTDTVASVNLDFMTAAIRSLVKPIWRLADGGFTPRWTANGQPEPDR